MMQTVRTHLPIIAAAHINNIQVFADLSNGKKAGDTKTGMSHKAETTFLMLVIRIPVKNTLTPPAF